MAIPPAHATEKPLTLSSEHPPAKSSGVHPGGLGIVQGNQHCLSPCCLFKHSPKPAKSSFKQMENEGRKPHACTDRSVYQNLFSRDKPYRGRRKPSVSHPKSSPLVPYFSLFVLPQGAVKPAQVHHGHVVSGAQEDGLPVVGHGSLGRPWRGGQPLNWCIRKTLSQTQHAVMFWFSSIYCSMHGKHFEKETLTQPFESKHKRNCCPN